VGVAPVLFFSAFDRRVGALKYFRNETLSQRAGQWLSMHFIEPFFAFFAEDFALMTVLKRQPWPKRTGVINIADVRKLSVSDSDRDTHIWQKVEADPEYQKLTRKIWSDLLTLGPRPTPEEAKKVRDEQIQRAAEAQRRGGNSLRRLSGAARPHPTRVVASFRRGCRAIHRETLPNPATGLWLVATELEKGELT
jgi:hypothetical protein